MKQIMFVLFVGIAAPLAAQVELVATVKADLAARGVHLSGPCGAFEITKRVAWQLRDQGVGLLAKPSGNHCDGYSVDYLVRSDLSGIDILSDAGESNGPAWQPSEPPGTFAGRWRAPFDPDPPPLNTAEPVATAPYTPPPVAEPAPVPASPAPVSPSQQNILLRALLRALSWFFGLIFCLEGHCS